MLRFRRYQVSDFDIVFRRVTLAQAIPETTFPNVHALNAQFRTR